MSAKDSSGTDGWHGMTSNERSLSEYFNIVNHIVNHPDSYNYTRPEVFIDGQKLTGWVDLKQSKDNIFFLPRNYWITQNMEIVTQRELIKLLPKHWDEHNPFDDDKTQKVLNELNNLDLDSVSPEEVIRIVGDKNWVTINCDECRDDCVSAFVFTHDEDKKECTVVCKACVCKAYLLIMDQ